MFHRRKTRLMALFGAIAALTGAAQADVVRVPEDSPTVLAAVANAQDGDVIDIGAGQWAGGIDLQGKAIVLRGRVPGRSILTNAGRVGPVLRCVSGEGQGTVFEDLVIRDGSGQSINGLPTITVGGGLLCRGSSPTVRRCIIETNTASLSGGGVYCDGGSTARFEDCTFRNNMSDKGGAVIVSDAAPVFVDCLFAKNRASFAGGGVYAADNSAMRIEGGKFVSNVAGFTGGGLYEYDAESTVTDVTFDRNRASLRGGAAYLGHDSRGSLDRCHFLSPTDELAGSRISLHRPPVRGGCVLDRWCVVSEEADCLLAGGVYLGDHVPCGASAQEAARITAGDVDFDGEIDDRDVALLMLLWR